jgi:hypothetical protein
MNLASNYLKQQTFFAILVKTEEMKYVILTDEFQLSCAITNIIIFKLSLLLI